MESDIDYKKLFKDTFPDILVIFFTGAPNFWVVFFFFLFLENFEIRKSARTNL